MDRLDGVEGFLSPSSGASSRRRRTGRGDGAKGGGKIVRYDINN